MNFKLQDFFINVIDFFSVILPGALVTFFLKGLLYTGVFVEEKVFPSLENRTQEVIVFLFATYIIGHIVFVIASLLDKLYGKLRDKFFKKNFDLNYHSATAIREQYIPSESWINQLIKDKKLGEKEIKKLLEKDKHEIINTYKWAQRFLAIKYPETLININKTEADSKFFRSLVIAFIIVSFVLLFREQLLYSACFFVLSLLSLYRYCNLRYKSTELAYEFIVTINHLEKYIKPEEDVYQDNRAIYLASKEDILKHQNRITALTKGLQVSSMMLVIPMNKTWKVVNALSFETIFCISGKCVVEIKTNNGKDKIVIIPNAIVSLPQGSSFEINNRQKDSLLLLAIK